MHLQSGTLFEGGKYRVIETLGRGGFGVTYLAEQVKLRRRVCIKEFFPKNYYKRNDDDSLTVSSDGFAEMMDKFKAKFVKEAQTTAALDHPNIIPVHDVFEENGTAYYVMDYIEGESLSELVKSNGAMSERDAVAYIKQIAAALEHIHDRKINHLDVKPGNIMVREEDNRAILIDFGLSKHYDASSGEATSTTPVGVSHGYAPMEQYKQGGVSKFSPETDIYSLGATLYYLVTGSVPPQAADIGKDGIGELPSELSSNVCVAIRKSMSYWKEDRPHTIKEFLALLDNKVVKPKPKKHRWWVWTLLLLFIVVLLMSIKDLFSNGDNSKEVATKEKTVYIPTNVTAPAPEESESLEAEEGCPDATYAEFAEVECPESEQKSDGLQAPNQEEPKEEAQAAVSVKAPDKEGPEEAVRITEEREDNIQQDDEIWYTSEGGKVIPCESNAFGATIISNTYANGRWVIKFDKAVTKIGYGAFFVCGSITSGSITSITIPNSVTEIGRLAFGGCSSLTTITIPNSVTKIGEGAFSGCSSLATITIPNSVTKIEEEAFNGCSNLKEFKGKYSTDRGRCLIMDNTIIAYAKASGSKYTIPYGVTEIGNRAFYDCVNLESITIPNSVTKIGEGAFCGCSSLATITIPNSVTVIGTGAFFECNNLISITIPDSVTEIGFRAFAECSSLTSITILDSVTEIHREAFDDCNSLKSVYCKATTPPYVAPHLSPFCYNDNMKIYVPHGSVEAYKNDEGWKVYAEFIIGYDF